MLVTVPKGLVPKILCGPWAPTILLKETQASPAGQCSTPILWGWVFANLTPTDQVGQLDSNHLLSN